MITAYYEDISSYVTADILGFQLADLLGPLWGGLLFNSLGYTGIFLLEALTSMVTGLLLCSFQGHERAHPLLHIQELDSLSIFKIFKIL